MGVVAVILAAGYGTRLENDMKADTSGRYDALRGIPKVRALATRRVLLAYRPRAC